MNNLMLSFSAADVSRLRTLVAAVGKEIALVPAAATAVQSPSPGTALDTTWARLVEMLDLGTEPQMRECPHCKSQCTLGATRCGRCWISLPSLKAAEKAMA
jgi:hypothetical protein